MMSVNLDVVEKLIPLADRHQQQDEYISGTYGRMNGAFRGCSVGCTVYDAIQIGVLSEKTKYGNHRAIAEATGIPEMCWHLADHIFEGLPQEQRRAWTPRFLRAAEKCKTPNHVPARIMARLAMRLAEDAIREDVKASALNVAGLWNRRANGDDPAEREWKAAWEQAYAAWEQAYAAREQAYAAREQAYAAREQFWQWCAEVVCEELAA